MLEKYQLIKEEFYKERKEEDGYKVMQKITSIINHLGSSFLEYNGGELAEIRTKLLGYKFYLSDYICDLQRISESIKIELKEIKAKRWNEISEKIKAKDGKVKNKEQIENALVLETKDLQIKQILYETMYHSYKLKLGSVDDALSAIMQRVKELQKQEADSYEPR